MEKTSMEFNLFHATKFLKTSKTTDNKIQSLNQLMAYKPYRKEEMKSIIQDLITPGEDSCGISEIVYIACILALHHMFSAFLFANGIIDNQVFENENENEQKTPIAVQSEIEEMLKNDSPYFKQSTTKIKKLQYFNEDQIQLNNFPNFNEFKDYLVKDHLIISNYSQKTDAYLRSSDFL
eukprot:TRINITY_DN16241_c0_g1_i1.p3 TRINITY_DN16241_c0_g1~~TRINITY_DN16241_c0_g1_i1.p3  ORF type:complete len:179 (+),score=31.97 TRINITY_DN16241_c0_g1_i1:656-1192(+)